MNNDTLLSKLLKAKSMQHKKKEEVIDEFIAQASALESKSLDESLASLLIFISQNLNNPMLEQLTEAKINALELFSMPGNIEETYQALARAGISFDKTDLNSLKAMQNNFHWLKEDYGVQTQEKLKALTRRVFRGEIPRSEMPGALKEQFAHLKEESLQYFEGVSDHIISQSQNIATVNQARKYDAPYYKVVAIMDAKTSPVCRSMHGRILKASAVEKQSDKIINARSIEEKKRASAWHEKPYNGKSDELAPNACLPPYHFRCRTEVVPVWIDDYEVDGVRMRASEPLGKNEVLRHIDRAGVERILTKNNYLHGNHSKLLRKKAPIRDIVKALNSINTIAPNKNTKHYVNALCDNGYVLIFDGDTIVTAIPPKMSKSEIVHYFKNGTYGDRKEIIKWQRDSFLSTFSRRSGRWGWLTLMKTKMMMIKDYLLKKSSASR